MRVLVHLLLCCGALLFPVHRAGAADAAAWLVEWDLDAGWNEAAVLAPATDSLQIFAASFNADDQPVLQPDLERWLSDHADDLAARRALLTVVNDVIRPDGQNTAKDAALITRLMATPEARARHMDALVRLAAQPGISGLDIDYEKVTDKDWPVLLSFCRDLAADPRMRGKGVRVVVEPNPRYFAVPYPPELDYVVMAYNLYGFHSGPGPKADAPFIARLAAQCHATGAAFRLALSTGGFLWRENGKTSSLTETAAEELSRAKNAPRRRDPLSRYLTFSYTDDDGTKCQVWYADADTLVNLIRTAKGFGFDKFDLWRLGGNAPETVEALAAALGRRGQTLRAHPDIASALSRAAPGDTILLPPGEYREDIAIDKSGLTIVGETSADGTPLSRISGGTASDSRNTVWRGIAFGSAVVLDGQTGRFERCSFAGAAEDAAEDDVAVRIVGGAPAFHGCRFAGGAGSALSATALSPDYPLVDFTYCLFTGFAGNLVMANENVDMRFANCLFADNGLLVNRPIKFRGEVTIANSVFYFNRSPRLTTVLPGAAPVRVTDSVYTPHFNERLWIMHDLMEKEPGVEMRRCRVGSPRFMDSGRPLLLNFGIDDTINAGVWEALASEAETHGAKVTLAVNTAVATDEDWARIRRTFERGHEIGSHSVSHASIQPDPPLLVGYGGKAPGAAGITIVPGESLVMHVDLSVALAPGVSINQVAQALRRGGAEVVVSAYHGGAPAAMLAGVSGMDIAFPGASVPLYLRNGEFIEFELAESRNALLEKFPELKELIFIAPFEVNTPAAKKAMARLGYSGARSTSEPGLSGAVGADVPDTEKIKASIYTLPSFSFRSVGRLVDGLSLHDNYLLALDFIKQRFRNFALYSHSFNELDLDGWKRVLAVAAADPKVELVTLAEMVRRIEAEGENLGEGIYALTPRPASYDYRPGPDSPMLGAGRRLGLPFDFAGKPVPPDADPNIGLYQ